MTNHSTKSRSHKNMKRRKNNRTILYLIFTAVILLVILVILIFSGNRDDVLGDDNSVEDNNRSDDNIGASTDEADIIKENDDNVEIITDIEQEENEDIFSDVVIQQVDTDDENVIEALVGNWPPIGTSQHEPHTTDYADGSADRVEIKKAVSEVTKIAESDLTELWVGNGGDQKVISTVTDKSKTNIYKVYLSWVEHEGWQVTKLEKIKEYIP